MIISRSILCRMRNVSDKSCRENQNTLFVFSIFFCFENRVVYEIMWKNIVERGKAQMIIWRLSISHCVPNATDTLSKYVVVLAFLLSKWLHERASILRYTYIACLVFSLNILNSYMQPYFGSRCSG